MYFLVFAENCLRFEHFMTTGKIAPEFGVRPVSVRHLFVAYVLCIHCLSGRLNHFRGCRSLFREFPLFVSIHVSNQILVPIAPVVAALHTTGVWLVLNDCALLKNGFVLRLFAATLMSGVYNKLNASAVVFVLMVSQLSLISTAIATAIDIAIDFLVSHRVVFQ